MRIRRIAGGMDGLPELAPLSTRTETIPLSIGTVSAMTGLSVPWIRTRLDDVLMPVKDSAGRRLYDAEVVAKFMAARQAARAERDAKRQMRGQSIRRRKP